MSKRVRPKPIFDNNIVHTRTQTKKQKNNNKQTNKQTHKPSMSGLIKSNHTQHST